MRGWVAPAVAALLALVPGCSAPSASAPSEGAAATLPGLPAAARVDYQLGGAYDPAPGELLLRDSAGHLVEDPDWPGEFLLDVSSAQHRADVLAVVGPWIDGCAAAGFDAVEPDNLDSWTRSDGLLTAADAARAVVARAHAAGLAVAQTNAPELTGADLGFDYAVAEDCQRYDECHTYTAAYGGAVLEVEYTAAAFDRACRLRADTVSLVRRDVGVSVPGDPDYVAAWCPAR